VDLPGDSGALPHSGEVRGVRFFLFIRIGRVQWVAGYKQGYVNHSSSMKKASSVCYDMRE